MVVGTCHRMRTVLVDWRSAGSTALDGGDGWERRRVQELCESRGGRPGLPVLMSLMVSVDVKQH